MPSDISSEKFNILQIFARRVRSVLRARGLTQNDLADGIRTTPSNVSNWLKCKAIPNALWVVKIADYLDTPLDQLFARDPGDPTPKIREYARRILELTGGVEPSRPKRRKRR